MNELIGSLVLLVGAFFLFSAGVGLLRMPDVFTRIQAGTKASTLGNILVLAGLGIHHPDWSLNSQEFFRQVDQLEGDHRRERLLLGLRWSGITFRLPGDLGE